MYCARALTWAAAGLLLFLCAAPLPACSTIRLQRGDELLYGHNLNNNGSDIPGLAFINQRGVFKTGRSWSEIFHQDRRNPSDVAWISRYGSVTFNTFGRDLPDGGMNEAGIYVWEMGLSNSEVVYPRDAGLPKLNQMQWMQYILDNAATLDEAIACATAFELDGWGWHFFLGDKDGHCAVVDFVDGRVVVHRGDEMPVPGLFNALYARETAQARYFKGFGGQYEPTLTDKRVPRYVKTGIMLQQYDGKQDAVDYTFQILDRLFVSEVADWSVVFDVKRRCVHFRTSRNRAVKHFSLDGFDFSGAGPTLILDIDIPEGGDVGRQFAPYGNDRMAAHIRTLPLPKSFCEAGGLTTDEFVQRLAGHTARAEDPRNQPFLGTWQTKTDKAGAAPRWQLTLRSRGDVVGGEISNAKGFVAGAPLEQIQLAGRVLSFACTSREEKEFLFARAVLEGEKMTLTLMGLEEEYGSFELFRAPAAGAPPPAHE